MTESDKRVFGVLTVITLMGISLFLLILRNILHPLSLQPGSSVYALGYYLGCLAVPGVGVFGWPLGAWLWSRGGTQKDQGSRFIMRIGGCMLWFLATVIVLAAVGVMLFVN